MALAGLRWSLRATQLFARSAAKLRLRLWLQVRANWSRLPDDPQLRLWLRLQLYLQVRATSHRTKLLENDLERHLTLAAFL